MYYAYYLPSVAGAVFSAFSVRHTPTHTLICKQNSRDLFFCAFFRVAHIFTNKVYELNFETFSAISTFEILLAVRLISKRSFGKNIQQNLSHLHIPMKAFCNMIWLIRFVFHILVVLLVLQLKLLPSLEFCPSILSSLVKPFSIT